MSSTKLYRVWKSMRARCGHIQGLDPAVVAHYAGRGIRVCEEWQTFPVFAEWALANGYAEGLTIDRSDNDKGYEPGNCRWVTQAVNNRNTRATKLSDRKVMGIRAMLSAGLGQTYIAGLYGVSPSSIGLIHRGRSWV